MGILGQGADGLPAPGRKPEEPCLFSLGPLLRKAAPHSCHAFLLGVSSTRLTVLRGHRVLLSGKGQEKFSVCTLRAPVLCVSAFQAL